MTEADMGLITVILERLRTQRLPRVLHLHAKVERGERLDDYDLHYLNEVMADAWRIQPLLERNPELREIGVKMVGLYADITARALKNERGGTDTKTNNFNTFPRHP